MTVNVWVLESVPWMTLPKSWDAGVMVRFAGVWPVPDSVAAAVPPGVAEAETDALLAPLVVGAKAAPSVQPAPAASVWPSQLSVDFEN